MWIFESFLNLDKGQDGNKENEFVLLREGDKQAKCKRRIGEIGF